MTVSILPPRIRNRKCRPIRVEGDIAFVSLTKGRVAVVDADDVPLISGRNWHTMTALPGMVCAATHVTKEDGSHDKALMHRVVLAAPDDLDVDHIDGDRLNNRKANLRLATNQQNCWNQQRGIRNTSGFKGVSWHSRDEVWQSNIRAVGGQVFLGYFKTAEEAAMAYNEAAPAAHGEFARLNVIGQS